MKILTMKNSLFKEKKTKVGHHWHICWNCKKDIEHTKTFKPKWPYPNLEREAVKELSKREDIIITNGDEGGAVVILDASNCIKEDEHQLNDKENYHILPQDPTLDSNKLVNQTIDHYKNEKLITEKMQTDLKRHIWDHCASTSLPKLLLVQSTVTQLT